MPTSATERQRYLLHSMWHRHQEFLAFLDCIDQTVDSRLDVHLVPDNSGTHKHPVVKKWLAARPRYRVHFTPTSSSWLNQIEHWSAEIIRRRIRRGTFRIVCELAQGIRLYNKNPRRLVWVASASQIFELFWSNAVALSTWFRILKFKAVLGIEHAPQA